MCIRDSIRAAEFDIVLHAVLEEIHILKDHGDISQQAFAGKFFHIVAAHRHGTPVRVIEAGYQIAYRALAGAGRLQGKAEVLCDQPVSYTHLDVYKRQAGRSVPSCVRRPMEANSSSSSMPSVFTLSLIHI